MFAWFDKFLSMPVATVLTIVFLGYLLGNIRVRSISLGSSGVLLVGLLFGHLGFTVDAAFKNWGLVCFVAAVGYSAGPVFFRIFQQKAFSYIILAISVVLSGLAVTILIAKAAVIPPDLALGLFNGALTSTPGLAAATEALGSGALVGYGIAYPFGVICVILFIQLIPRVLRINIKEQAKQKTQEVSISKRRVVIRPWYHAVNQCLDNYLLLTKNITLYSTEKKETILNANQKLKTGDCLMLHGNNDDIEHDISLLQGQLWTIDKLGIFNFSLIIVLGMLLAKIEVSLFNGGTFSLGNSGGPLIIGLLAGHLGYCSRLSLKIPKSTLNVLQEMGMLFFLAGAGTEAGRSVVSVLQQYGVMLFVFGAVITIAAMLLGYIIARFVFHFDIVDTLGSICGSMTSTPSLGVLIQTSESDIAAAIYAVTYPIALVMMIVSAQIATFVF